MRSFGMNLPGRVRNFPLPNDKPLIPLFEAVVNSFHAIDERKKADASFSRGEITINILREKQIPIAESHVLPAVVGFSVTDNGCGFTDENMDSFLEADSEKKLGIGGKGVGRFSWLKVFSSCEVESIYFENNDPYKRTFVFSLDEKELNDVPAECPEANDCLTTVSMQGVVNSFQTSLAKSIESIDMKLLQHCLIYFLNPDCPCVVICDYDSRKNLNDVFHKQFKSESDSHNVAVGDDEFELLSIHIHEPQFKGNKLYLCANNRLVDPINLENEIADLDKGIVEDLGYWYIGVLRGQYLDNNVDMNRLSFNIPEKARDESMTEKVSKERIVKAACDQIQVLLADHLTQVKDAKVDRIKRFAETQEPQFRHLLKYQESDILGLKPHLTDDKLSDELYRIKRKFDKELTKETKGLIRKIADETLLPENYKEYFNEQISKISDANGSALAEYVLHRHVIIDLFEKGLYRNDDGGFDKEGYMHQMIYPMRTTSEELPYNQHNLWLIDEKLSYCTYISSDVPFDNSNKEKRTDILMLDNPVAVSDDKNDGREFDSIIIFELKKPMRDDYTDSDNPIKQLYEYVRKIRTGNAKDKNHRPIRVNESTKFYLYAVCDVTKKLEPIIDEQNFTQTPDKLGYYTYNDRYKAYFEILSYDKILNDAKKRNRVLFDHLGI